RYLFCGSVHEEAVIHRDSVSAQCVLSSRAPRCFSLARNAAWPRRSTVDQSEEARLEFGANSLQERSILAVLAVTERDSCGQAGYQWDTRRHMVDRNADRHALRQAYPGVNGIDVGQTLRGSRCVGYADATRHCRDVTCDGH